MSTISGLSASALYAKAKAVYASHLTQGAFAELAAMTDFAEFVGYVRTKTPYAEAFEAVGSTGKLSRRQFEGIIKRMTLMRLEKILAVCVVMRRRHHRLFPHEARMRMHHPPPAPTGRL